jgi:chromosome segregation ATPase
MSADNLNTFGVVVQVDDTALINKLAGAVGAVGDEAEGAAKQLEELGDVSDKATKPVEELTAKEKELVSTMRDLNMQISEIVGEIDKLSSRTGENKTRWQTLKNELLQINLPLSQLKQELSTVFKGDYDNQVVSVFNQLLAVVSQGNSQLGSFGRSLVNMPVPEFRATIQTVNTEISRTTVDVSNLEKELTKLGATFTEISSHEVRLLAGAAADKEALDVYADALTIMKLYKDLGIAEPIKIAPAPDEVERAAQMSVALEKITENMKMQEAEAAALKTRYDDLNRSREEAKQFEQIKLEIVAPPDPLKSIQNAVIDISESLNELLERFSTGFAKLSNVPSPVEGMDKSVEVLTETFKRLDEELMQKVKDLSSVKDSTDYAAEGVKGLYDASKSAVVGLQQAADTLATLREAALKSFPTRELTEQLGLLGDAADELTGPVTRLSSEFGSMSESVKSVNDDMAELGRQFADGEISSKAMAEQLKQLKEDVDETGKGFSDLGSKQDAALGKGMRGGTNLNKVMRSLAIDGLSGVIKRIPLLDGLSKSMGGAVQAATALVSVLSSVWGVFRQVTSALVGFNFSFTEIVKQGLAYQKELEQMQHNMAGVINANMQLAHGQERLLKGAESYNAALNISAEMLRRAQAASFRSAATAQEMTANISAALVVGAQYTANWEKLTQLAINASNAAKQLGVEQDVVATGLKAILEGRQVEENRLSRLLGIDNRRIRALQQQAKALGNSEYFIDALNKQFQIYTDNAEMADKSFARISKNMGEAIKIASAYVSGDAMKSMANVMKEFTDGLAIVNKESVEVGSRWRNILGVARAVNTVVTGLGTGFLRLFMKVADVLESVFTLLKSIGIAELWDAVKVAVGGIWDALLGIIDVAANLVRFVAALFIELGRVLNLVRGVKNETGLIRDLLVGLAQFLELVLGTVQLIVNGWRMIATILANLDDLDAMERKLQEITNETNAIKDNMHGILTGSRNVANEQERMRTIMRDYALYIDKTSKAYNSLTRAIREARINEARARNESAQAYWALELKLGIKTQEQVLRARLNGELALLRLENQLLKIDQEALSIDGKTATMLDAAIKNTGELTTAKLTSAVIAGEESKAAKESADAAERHLVAAQELAEIESKARGVSSEEVRQLKAQSTSREHLKHLVQQTMEANEKMYGPQAVAKATEVERLAVAAADAKERELKAQGKGGETVESQLIAARRYVELGGKINANQQKLNGLLSQFKIDMLGLDDAADARIEALDKEIAALEKVNQVIDISVDARRLVQEADIETKRMTEGIRDEQERLTKATEIYKNLIKVLPQDIQKLALEYRATNNEELQGRLLRAVELKQEKYALDAIAGALKEVEEANSRAYDVSLPHEAIKMNNSMATAIRGSIAAYNALRDAGAQSVNEIMDRVADLERKLTELERDSTEKARTIRSEYDSIFSDALSNARGPEVLTFRLNLVDRALEETLENLYKLPEELRESAKEAATFGAELEKAQLSLENLAHNSVVSVGTIQGAFRGLGAAQTVEIAANFKQSQELITAQLDYMVAAGDTASEQFRQVQIAANMMKDGVTYAFTQMGLAVTDVVLNNMQTALQGFLDGTRTWKETVQEFLRSLGASFVQLGLDILFAVAKQLIMNAIAKVFGTISDENLKKSKQAGDVAQKNAAKIGVSAGVLAGEALGLAATLTFLDGVLKNTAFYGMLFAWSSAAAATAAAHTAAAVAGAGVVGAAEGGYISGPGSATSDSIPAMLSNGEYVVKASAVKQWGVGFLDRINSGLALPTLALANGGIIDAGGGSPAVNVAAPNVEVSNRIVNVVDPSLMQEAMQTREGEKLVLNIIRRNPKFINEVTGRR